MIVAMLAMILMGSVVLRAAEINVHNIHSNQLLTVEFYRFGELQDYDTFPIGEVTTSTTFNYTKSLVFGDWIVKAHQGSREAAVYFFHNGINECDITLPGAWEKLPGQNNPH